MRKFKRPQLLSKPVEAAGRIGKCSNESDLVIYNTASRLGDGPRSPLQELKRTARDNGTCRFYKILYTKRNANKKRKNKTFADGVLEVKPDTTCSLYSEEGKLISKSKVKCCEGMPEGAELIVGNWEVEVDTTITEATFRSGQCFTQAATVNSCVEEAQLDTQAVQGFKKPFKSGLQKAVVRDRPAQFDPSAEGACVLNQSRVGNEVAVVVDPYLSRKLRPHQKEGVAFLYDCVMGAKSASNLGAILADDMGLGKTLQIISLLWTLLRQGPKGFPAAKRAVVVAPSSLIQNWAAEFKKWLGDERLPVMVLQAGLDAKQQVVDFKFGSLHKVMIASYETLRKHCSELSGFCDVLVCDEGHRLKAAAGSKTMDSLLSLNCPRRVILTGTPIQNNLEEFFALVSFVNPNALSASSFRTVFAGPISRAQDKNATEEEVALGEERSAALKAIMDGFLLRRTKDVIAKLLPPLSSYVVFCPPTPEQVSWYQKVVASRLVKSLISGAGAFDALPAITLLRKICNHPSLLSAEERQQFESTGLLDGPNASEADPDSSGKMRCMMAILGKALQIKERVVVVSNSVQALNVIEGVCRKQSWTTVRIDGSMAADQRQSVVVNFNLYNIGQICLLSTRAGGAGLNLIGANRLILYDSDWNPAMDLQAMARVWRDGQTRPCVVYRLLTTGSIDEKIFQRQIMKGGLASSLGAVKGAAGSKGGFSREELRELFVLDTDTKCATHDLLKGSFRDARSEVDDSCLREVVDLSPSLVSFVHLNTDASSQLSAGDTLDETEKL